MSARRSSLTSVITAAVLGGCCANVPAATINVPPVVINSLAHEHYYDSFLGQTYTRDKVQFPCTGGACSGPGFSAAVGTGDTVVIRLQAPAGRRFRVTKSSLGNQYFTTWAHWQTMTSDALSNSVQPAVTFENLTGVAPTLDYNLTGVSNNGQAILTERNYTVTADFTFTAIQIQFTVTHALASMMRTYGPVNSYSSTSFGSSRTVAGNNVADATLMTIEDVPLPLEPVPPVVIHKLTHYHVANDIETSTSDYVHFPCSGVACTSEGFDGSLGTGDMVVVRIEAPVGKKFAVTLAPHWVQSLYIDARWHTNAPETAGTASNETVQFENLTGPAPSTYYLHGGVSTNGQTISVDAGFDIVGDCLFTAVQMQFQITHALADISRAYNPVVASTGQGAGFGVNRYHHGGWSDTTVMRILPICPGDATGNSVVDIDDIVAVITGWGSSGGNGDVNGDGIVNIDDLVAVVTGWGACP